MNSNYNYTEEHYAEMYNNLPEGLKDLVLSGRLALQVAAIGTRHGLNADQVADLEPAVEDVCLGLILKSELAENIKAQVGTDDRVSNRVAAEVEIEILRPFEPELVIARQQKQDLDKKIASPSRTTSTVLTPSPSPSERRGVQSSATGQIAKQEFEPKNVSEHTNVTAIKNFYNSSSNSDVNNNGQQENVKSNSNVNFDWDNFGKKPAPEPGLRGLNDSADVSAQVPQEPVISVEAKLDKLTDTINKLVESRFGGEKKEEGMSEEMRKIIERLEKAEKENLENKNLIKKLQGENPPSTLTNIFSKSEPGLRGLNDSADLTNSNANKIQIDKPRSVEIDKTQTPKVADNSGNVKVTSLTQNNIPIQKASEGIDLQGDFAKNLTSEKKPEVHMYSSTVTQDTADTIVETRNKETQNVPVTTSTKKVLTLDELIANGDKKIAEANRNTAQVVFPTVNNDKIIDIKNIAQTDTLRQTLLEDLEFLKSKNSSNNSTIKNYIVDTTIKNTSTNNDETDVNHNNNVQAATLDLGASNQSSVTLSQFKDELIPKTKEDRMKALQDKIKAMNKGVSSGGANSIAATALDPYKI